MAAVVLGIYGSPRKGGNTDQLLDSALEGAESAGASLRTVYARTLTMSGCIECGGCDRTGKCVVNDDMQRVYPSLIEADLVFLASPVFFYGVTAQVKALIDRAQALWAKRLLEKSPEQRKRFDGGKGYLISTGATKGAQLFEGAILTARYFFDALDMDYAGELFFRGMERKSDTTRDPDTLKKAFEFGASAVKAFTRG